MYSKIICPVDGSDVSDRGMREAILLARDQKARLIFLNVVDLTDLVRHGPAFGTECKPWRDAGDAALAAAIEEAHEHGVKAERRMVEIMSGAPGEIIVQEAQRYDADLIVMGTHGRRGLSRLLVGSDAALVIGRCRAPVLLVK